MAVTIHNKLSRELKEFFGIYLMLLVGLFFSCISVYSLYQQFGQFTIRMVYPGSIFFITLFFIIVLSTTRSKLMQSITVDVANSAITLDYFGKSPLVFQSSEIKSITCMKQKSYTKINKPPVGVYTVLVYTASKKMYYFTPHNTESSDILMKEVQKFKHTHNIT